MPFTLKRALFGAKKKVPAEVIDRDFYGMFYVISSLLYVQVLVKLVSKVAGLLSLAILMLEAAWMTLATVLTVTALLTRTTLATVRAWAALTLYIAFGLLHEHAV